MDHDIATRMKTTIEIAPAILERGKQLARKEHVTLRALVEEGLRTVIEARTQKAAFKLGRIHFTGGGFRDGLDSASWDQIRGAIYDGRGS